MALPKQEVRTFQYTYLDKLNNMRRVFNNRRSIDVNSVDSSSYFDSGFAFKKLPKDGMFVPKHYENDQDLFSQFYDKLMETGILKDYIKEITQFFEKNGKPIPGCFIHDRRSEVKAPAENIENIYENLDEDFMSRKTVIVPQMKRSTVIAKQPVQEGERILKEKPMILCKPPCCKCSGNYYFECNHCSKVIDRYHCCPDCNLAIYCSNTCKSEAYSQYHLIECKAFRVHFFGKSDIAWVAFRMLLTGVTCKSSTYKLENMDILGLLRKTTLILTYMVMYTEFFDMAKEQACFPANMTVYEMHMMIGGLLITNIKQACIMTFYFPDEKHSLHTYTNGNRLETPGLCKRLMLFAHSCNPNATIIFENNVYYIKALRDIKAYDEITVNYIHLDEEFYGCCLKYKCLCPSCTIPNKYTGKFYKCFKCEHPKGQKMEHYPPMWKCSDCSTFEINAEMDAKLGQMKQMLIDIECMDSKEYKPMLSMLLLYLDIYDTVYSKIYPDHLYICQKLALHSIENEDIDTIEKYAMSLVEALSSFLHKYSYQRLETLVSIICAIERKLMQKGRTKVIRTLLQIRKSAMSCIKSLCTFYMLTPQYNELLAVVNKIESNV